MVDRADTNALGQAFDTAFARLGQAAQHDNTLQWRESGIITRVASGIVWVEGLLGAGYEELLAFPGGLYGIAFDLDETGIGVVLLGDESRLQTGMRVERTGRVMDVPVGEALIGRVINPLGEALDSLGPTETGERWPIERPAPPIMQRLPVEVPLQTGIKVIDAMIPVGRGQRELILGDRQTGKTTLALDALLNQRDQNVLCVYCAIGQRTASVVQVVQTLRETGALAWTVVLVSGGSDAPGLSYIAPYAATSIAEWFMAHGRDVLIVYDDLISHARSYRELSLLLRRPPGREAYPGDIFYIHSRLLERSTRLRPEQGGGSLTALPIVETEAQDMSAYIPTNLISITDGQIYLSPDLFELGVLPAVDVGRSVSRVGGKAQHAAYHTLTGDLKLAYAQFEELESFARFGARLDDASRQILVHGERIRACLKQVAHQPWSLLEQIIVLVALTGKAFDEISRDEMPQAEQKVRAAVSTLDVALIQRLQGDEPLSAEDRQALLVVAQMVLQTKLRDVTA